MKRELARAKGRKQQNIRSAVLSAVGLGVVGAVIAGIALTQGDERSLPPVDRGGSPAIVVASQDSLYVVDPSDGERRSLIGGSDLLARHPRWVPGRDRIVFSGQANNDDVPADVEIYTVDLQTDRIVELTDTPAQELAPAISRGGTLAFARTEPKGSEILGTEHDLVVRTAGGESVVGDSKDAGFPDWAPSGKQLAFARFAPEGRAGVYEARPNEKGTWELAPVSSGRGDHSPAWAPDGLRLAVLRQAGRNSDLYVLGPSIRQEGGDPFTPSIDGDQIERLTEGRYAISPRWTDDGTGIAFAEPVDPFDPMKGHNIMLLDVDRRTIKKLAGPFTAFGGFDIRGR